MLADGIPSAARREYGRLDGAMRCGHNDHMGGSVGVRELKTRLGRYLRRVRRGERLVVTDRGEPVAELRPLEGAAAEEAGLRALEALGILTRTGDGRLTPFRALQSTGRPASDAVREGREDRF